jgi:hypothetical protein
MNSKIKAVATAIEWDFRTPQATRYCEDAFSPFIGANTLSYSVIGFQQPVKLSRNSVNALSSYDILTYNKGRVGDVIIEKLDDEIFTVVSKAVFASHLGNADVILTSRIESITANGWPINGQIKRTILRDMLIFTPEDPEDMLRDMEKQRPTAYAKQKALGFPGLCVIVLAPPKSNHARINNLQLAAHGTELGQIILGDHSFDLHSPTTIHFSS